MISVLESIKPVVENSKTVRINGKAIERFCKIIKSNEFDKSEFVPETILPETATEEQQIALAFVYNAINFCYWGEPKWTIEIKGNFYDGSAAMLRAIKNAIREGVPLTDPGYLEGLPENDLREILRGNIEIPLFLERLGLLRDLGKNIRLKFKGSFSNR